MSANVTLIGAGPIGCAMASMLATQGISCIIYEKRADPRTVRDTGKSINLALSTRGLTALGTLFPNPKKLLPCIESAVPMYGRIIKTKDGETLYQPYSPDGKSYLHSVNRADLNNQLITVAEAGGIKVVFQHEVQAIDFHKKQVIFKDISSGGKMVVVDYETLWGTDGSNSKVRMELERIHGVPEEKSKVIKFKAGYKEFEILAKNGKSQLEPKTAFYVWPRDGGNFFIALPNADNTYTCTMFSMISSPECIANFNDEQIVAYFKKEFSDVANMMGDEKIKHDHRVNPFSGLYSVDVDQWHYKGEVVIMGDAAHGVVPYYGLGINGGFEGCRHMLNLVKKYSTNKIPNWEIIFHEFNKYKAHTDVLRLGSIRNAEELHKRVKDTKFLFEKEVERQLETKYPSQFIEAHSLLSFTNVPLETCGRHIQIQERIVKDICNGKSEISQINWDHVHKLIQERLGNFNLFEEMMWYEKSKL